MVAGRQQFAVKLLGERFENRDKTRTAKKTRRLTLVDGPTSSTLLGRRRPMAN